MRKTYTLKSGHFPAPSLIVKVCDDKQEVQEFFRHHFGYLTSDMTDVSWVDFCGRLKATHGGQDLIYCAIRKDASAGRIAHEAHHGAVLWAAHYLIDPTDMRLIRPQVEGVPEDYGYIPGEIVAEMVEQIVDCVMDCMSNRQR